MRLSSVVGALLLGICTNLPYGFAEDDVIPVHIDIDDGATVINNKRKCMNAGGLVATTRCPTFTSEESAACPSGVCYRWGCIVAPNNPPHLHGKETQYEEMNSGEFSNPIDSSPNGGFQVELVGKIVCYKARSCICKVDDANSSATCEAGKWQEYGIAKYKVTSHACLDIIEGGQGEDPIIP